MKRLLEVLNASADYLAKKGVPSPRLQAEMLMAHVLKLERMALYLEFERPLNDETLDTLRPLVKRRGEHEPLQHILGEVEFLGLRFQCAPEALIPRPETELLVETVIDRLTGTSPQLLYDVGTGSGVIALTLACRFPGVRVLAIDSDERALELARTNHALHPNAQVEWKHGDLLCEAQENASAVLANLPYLTSEEMLSLPPDVRRDPVNALDGGADGLDLIRRLIPQAAKLAPRLFLEIGINQAKEVSELMRLSGYEVTEIVKDLADRDRFVFGMKKAQE